MRPRGPASRPRPVEVTEVEELSRSMRRLRLQGEALRGVEVLPGQQFRVQIPEGGEVPPETYRTYSVWNDDTEAGWIDLVVFLHLEGPGSRWAAAARPGEALDVFGPVGAFVVDRNAPYHLFLGEETAAVAIQGMLRALPADARVYVRLEADAEEDALPPVSPFEEGCWVYRRGAPAGRESALVHALESLELPETPGVAYVAGELGACMALRDHLLKSRSWRRRDVRVKPFWAPDKIGLT